MAKVIAFAYTIKSHDQSDPIVSHMHNRQSLVADTVIAEVLRFRILWLTSTGSTHTCTCSGTTTREAIAVLSPTIAVGMK